ncbi:hypothetical protein WMY93_025942 [Mugilogobius chulae]|uniref:Receptor ligand binding region domain-containing protein n=1 Tax=Mugilogobius chulae TaxID=88201 RepID=A0AAW0MW72_9GOBI
MEIGRRDGEFEKAEREGNGERREGIWHQELPLLERYISASPSAGCHGRHTYSLSPIGAGRVGRSAGRLPHLLLRPSPRERDAGAIMNFNIAVIHAGATVQAEAAVAGPGGRVLYPGFGRVYGSLGESVVTQWGSANVIWLQVNDSSPKTVLSQLCELLAARPLQGLVPNWTAHSGSGRGAGLGRMPQESGSIFLQFSSSTALQLEVIFEVLEEYDWTAFSVVSTVTMVTRTSCQWWRA